MRKQVSLLIPNLQKLSLFGGIDSAPDYEDMNMLLHP